MKCYNLHLIKDQIVPCGKCLACRALKRRQWTFRLKEESYASLSAKFITLTYDDDSLPISSNGIPTVHNPDITTWMHNLRDKVRKDYGLRLRYYSVSEYGGRFSRPHFHSIVFNLPDDYIIPKWNKKTEIWEYPHLHNSWSKGIVDVDECTPNSMAYVAGYCIDKLTARQRGEYLHLDTGQIVKDDRTPEKNFMSKGIGKNWLTPEIIKYFRQTCTPYITETNGYRLPFPRYYREKIFNTPELKAKYLKALDEHREKLDPDLSYRAKIEAIKARNRTQRRRMIQKGYSTANLDAFISAPVRL